MGYLGFRFQSLRLKIMLCLGSYLLYKLQEPGFMFLATGP